MNYNERILKLGQGLTKVKAKAILISNPSNIRYLSGFVGSSETEREVWMLIVDKNIYFFTDARYYDSIKYSVFSIKNLQTKLIDSEHKLTDQIAHILENKKIKKLGFEQDDLRYSEWSKISKVLSKIELMAMPSLVTDLRQIKSNDEIKKLKNACQLTTEILTALIPFLKPGVTEKELAWKLELMTREAGAELSFPPIVAIDANAASPHYNSQAFGKGKIKSNSIILIDFGVKFDGYCSDMTRMVFVGEPEAEIKNIYDRLLEVQEKAITMARPGNKASSIDAFCRSELLKNKLPNIPHSTGHGVGLDIHEMPHISTHSKETLEAGMTITIEPGVYFTGKYGMRIEDTVVVTEGKPTILTKFPKEIIII